MATRFYVMDATNTAPVSPTPDGSWEVTASLIRRELTTGKTGASETKAIATTLNVPAGAVDVLCVQAISAPLDSNQTISGNISGQAMCLESNAAADMDAQMVIWVAKSDLTSRGTLIASNTTALSHEFNTSARNISWPKGGSTTPTTVNAQTGDRLVVEWGFRKHENATTSRTGTIILGNPSGTDLPVDETSTSGVPWIEFADNLTFTATKARVSQVPVEVAVTPDSKARISQVAVEVLRPSGSPSTQLVRIARGQIIY